VDSDSLRQTLLAGDWIAMDKTVVARDGLDEAVRDGWRCSGHEGSEPGTGRRTRVYFEGATNAAARGDFDAFGSGLGEQAGYLPLVQRPGLAEVCGVLALSSNT
jgi:hypothetical protein